MERQFVYISHYFLGAKHKNYSDRDFEIVKELQERIDSFEDEYDAYKYLFNRRQSSFFVEEDYRLFGIPKEAEIDLNYGHKNNRYYNKEYDEKYNKEKEGKHNRNKSLDSYYTKHDIHGLTKYNKDGSVAEYTGMARKGINLALKAKNSKTAKNAMYIVKHFKFFLTMFLVILAIIILTILGCFITGTINSIGHSPFILCGSDSNTTIKASNPDENADKMSADYTANLFIQNALDRGWKANAIIGALSYVLTEGHSTFSYESYWLLEGPSGVTSDTTLNNDAWRAFIESDDMHQKIINYNKSYRQNHFAFGIGILGDSDVWDNGSKTASNATNLINYCENYNRGPNDPPTPWQDPSAQMSWVFDKRFAAGTAFDTTGCDPTKDDRTAEEWCRRVTAGIGMPAYKYTYNNDYMKNHLKPLDRATAYFENFTGVEVESLISSTGFDACGSLANGSAAGVQSFITGDVQGANSIAVAAVNMATGCEKFSDDRCGKGLSCPLLTDARMNLYVTQHKIFWGNSDTYFADCGRSTATAIRYSGADNTFPKGPTDAIYNYLCSSDKWEYVGDWGSVELQPGDVGVTKGKGHVKIYVGNEFVKQRFPESDGDVYEGSMEYSGNPGYFPYVHKEYNDSRTFAVFRLVKSDN